MTRKDAVRPLVVGCTCLAFLGGSAGVVIAAQGGDGNGNGAGTNAYDKPGCGPDKTDGTAGSSGTHTGQPPKDQDRGDCPTPPGQNQ
jgi:hypothetical protein